MKRTNDKGFSLIELIVVLAMMAVLTAVLVPLLLNYVERSRMQKDESALDEILNCTHIALSVDRVYNDAQSTGISVTIADNAMISANSVPLQEELRRLVPDPVVFESKFYQRRGGESIDITFSNPHGTFILEPSWTESN